MNDRFLKARKYVVLALFLLFCVLSLIAMRLVVINYNISDYLNEKTETKISLDIIANEFGAASDVQVMVRDVTVDEALEICDTIRNIKDVVNVNFDYCFVSNVLCKVNSPGAVATVVVSKLFTADKNVSRGVRTADFKVVAVSCGKVCLFDCFFSC